jgi:two-component system, OmpR family, response regulator
MNVLLVDDSAPVRTRLARMVREIEGVVVVEAAGADDAFALLDAVAFAVVVVDVHMAPRSGLELLNALQGSDALLVAMTNEPTETLKQACLARGARHFIDKSRDFHRLAEFVRTAMS